MDQPVVCTLSPQQYVERTEALARLGDEALRSREPIEGGERLTFDGSSETERALAAAVAAEAACCSFLTMDLRRADERLVLDIIGPELAQPIIAELFA